MVPKNMVKRICEAVRDYLDLVLDKRTDRSLALLDSPLRKSIKKISDIFMESDEIKVKYSSRDIEDSFMFMVMRLAKDVSDINDKDVANYVNKIISSRGNTVCYVPLYGLENFPEGYRIGNSKITLFENLPEEMKEHVDLHYTHEYEQRGEEESQLNLEDYKKKHISRHWICRRLDGVGHYRLSEEAYKKVNDDLNILRIAYKHNREVITLNHKDFFYFDPETKLPSSSHVIINTILYLESVDSEIELLNSIFLKDEDQKSDIDHRIANSLNLYGLMTTVTPIEIKFILVMTALEGLLLGNDDINYLGKRLSEKIAFIIGKDRESRMSIYDTMKEMYTKRSSFSHQKQKKKVKEMITESNFQYLSNTFMRVVRRMLELQKEFNITTIEEEDKADTKSLNEYIKNLMFS
ncbi:MAG: HEPN domain-containing protein [Methanocellales archaeon]|nr:HEPN domain-containing protein [Methanocellales archaeon]